jgi:hypothetical protein
LRISQIEQRNTLMILIKIAIFKEFMFLKELLNHGYIIYSQVFRSEMTTKHSYILGNSASILEHRFPYFCAVISNKYGIMPLKHSKTSLVSFFSFYYSFRGSFCNAVNTRIIASRWVWLLMCDELKTIWKKVVMCKRGTIPEVCLEWLRKSMKDLNQVTGVPGETQTDHLPENDLQCIG